MIYLFHGPDDFGRRQAVAALKAAIPADVADLNLAVLEGRGLKLPELRTACDAFPMLHDRRLVIVHDLLKHAKSAEMRDGLRTLLAKLPPTTDLALNEQDAPDQRIALAKDLQAMAKAKTAQVREFPLLEGSALLGFITEHARQLGAPIRPEAARLLADFLGADGWAIHNELTKLAVYVGQGGTITPREIQLLVADDSETNLFQFIDALCGRRGGAAVQGLHGLLADGAAPIYLLAMIARQVRLMLAAQAAGRASPDDLARQLGQKPFVARKALDQARGYSAPELRAFHQRVLEFDHAIKTGRVDPEGALSLIVGEFGFPPPRPANARR